MSNLVQNILKEIYTNIIINNTPCSSRSKEYNIFSVLGVQNDERKMCRILADFLDPLGMHGQGSLYLELFLKEVLIGGGYYPESYFDGCNYQNARVRTEINISDSKSNNYGYIDIGIWLGKRFVPIEVKIYACDQEYQCYRYYTYAKEIDTEAKVCYLARKGNSSPSDFSISNEKQDCLNENQYFTISFEKEIKHWLSKCCEASRSRNLSAIIEVIEQLIETVDEFTKDGKEELNMDVIKTIMSSKGNIQAAFLVEEHIKTAKIKMIENLMSAIEERIDASCDKIGLEKEVEYYYYKDVANSFYNKYESSYPGINYYCKNVKLSDELELWFRVEIEHKLYAGFCVYDKKMQFQKDDFKSMTLEEICNQIPKIDINREDWWVSWKYLPTGSVDSEDECPNFKIFWDKQAVEFNSYTSLFDNDYFKVFVDRCMSHINEMLEALN